MRADHRSSARVGLWGIAVLSVAAVGALVGAAVVAPSAPAALAPPARTSSYPVGTATFDDSRAVSVRLTSAPETPLVAPRPGRLTATSCTTGTTFRTGTSPLAIDGEPVVALATSLPLWRDLTIGDSGPDATALQGALVDLGYPVETDGTVGATTVDAFADLVVRAGGTPPLDRAAVGDVLWIPYPETVVDRCGLPLGSWVEDRDEVAVTPGVVNHAEILDLPDDLIAGPRALVLDGERIPVDPTDPSLGPDALARLSSLASVRRALDGDEPVAARLVLSEGLVVSTVPPSAVVGTDGERPCVLSEGTPRPVEVVGSELGQTFVVVDGPAPSTVDSAPPAGSTCR